MILPFFLKNNESVINLEEILSDSHFSGLKPSKSKCQIAGIGVLKEVKVALLWHEMSKPLRRYHQNTQNSLFIK